MYDANFKFCRLKNDPVVLYNKQVYCIVRIACRRET